MRSVLLWLAAASSCMVSATAFVPSTCNRHLPVWGLSRRQQTVFHAASEGHIDVDSEMDQVVNGKDLAEMEEEVVPERMPQPDPILPTATAFAEPETLSSSFYIPDEDEARQLDDERYMQMAIDLVQEA